MSQPDAVIALMGITGVGKSNFIKTAVGSEGEVPEVGNKLSGCTTMVRGFRACHPSIQCRSIMLIDTPGFETEDTDAAVLEKVTSWLKETYEGGARLTGIIYLHRITDNRLGWAPRQNWGTFRKLLGDDSMQNIILVTTMWTRNKNQMGEQRERELRDKHWKTMLGRGSALHRFEDTRDSAWAIIDLVTSGDRQPRRVDSVNFGPANVDLVVAPFKQRNRWRIVSKEKNHGIKHSDASPQRKEAPILMLRKIKSEGSLMQLARWRDQMEQHAEKELKAEVTPIKVEELSEKDLIIAVTGPTGAGKSSFLRTATGGDMAVGHTLEPCTRAIQLFRLHGPERTGLDIVFVDTPGIDINIDEGVEPVETIVEWLKRINTKLTGIIYLHRISNNHLTALAINKFRTMGKDNAPRNIVYATTMWDEVDEHVGSQRERELGVKFSRGGAGQGCKPLRYHGTFKSAWEILDHCLRPNLA